jgi:membrane associated rhomboid family serine protease
MALLDDIKFQFRTGNMLMQLIYVNGGIFLLMMVFRLIFFLSGNEGVFNQAVLQLTIPADPKLLLMRPWTLITHMFVHANFLHVLFNMVWLYFGGTIFLNFLDSKKLLSTFVLGGLSGALFFVAAMNLFPVFNATAPYASAEGASAAVLAIVVAAATMVPNYVVQLVLIGPVRLKYIAIVLVLLDLIFIPSGNAGGHIGHLGGAFFGFVYASQLKRGNDLTVDFLKPWFWLKKKFPKGNRRIKVVHSKHRSDEAFNAARNERQVEVDAILDKIKRSGYESLSKHEKDILFKASKEL